MKKLLLILLCVPLMFSCGQIEHKNIESDRIFYAYYDNVSGLTEGSSVTVQGYKVGTVTEIAFDQEINYQTSQRSLKVKFVVWNNRFDIPENSVAKIVSVDLMGTKGINLMLGNSENKANNNDVLLSSIELSLQDEVNAQISPLNNRIDSLLTVITSVLDKDELLQSLDSTFSALSSINAGDTVIWNTVVIDSLERLLSVDIDSSLTLDEFLVDIKNNPKRYVNFSIIDNNKLYVEPK